MPASLPGRDADLERTLHALRTRGRVLLEGPAGIGKTALLRAVLEHERERGVALLRCAPTETETVLPLAALADVLGPLRGALEALPGPQRVAVAAALLVGDLPAAVDERALAVATAALLTAAADAHPEGVLLAVDDAPWLDPPSERALRFALRRTPPGVRVVVARRTGEAPDGPVPLDLDAAGPVERLTVGPLGVGPLHRLLAERFGVALSRPLITRVARESGGNPLLAVELTRAVLRLPRVPGPGEDLPVPTSVHELVTASLAGLGPDSLRAARVAALLSAPDLPALRAAGVDDAALDALEEAGLVTVDDLGRVRFLHPTYASAVRAAVPAGIRRGLHATLAATAPDDDERARHLALGTGAPDAAVADALARSAARIRARGAADLAAASYDRAAELATDPDTAARLRLLALDCRFDGGEYPVVAARADALAERLDGALRAEALLLRAAVAFAGDDLPLAAAVAERALAAAAPSSRLAGRIHAHLAVFCDQPAAAGRHADAALSLLDDDAVDLGAATRAGRADDVVQDAARGRTALGGTDRALLASVLMSVFLNEVRTGRPPRTDLLDRALDLEDGVPSVLAGTIAAIWWKGTDQLERARDRLQWMLDVARHAGDEPSQHEALQHLAETATLAADLETAARHVAAARELAGQLGSGELAERWLGGMVAAYRGDLAEAAAAGEAGLAEAAVSGDPWLQRISLQLVGLAALFGGRHDVAAVALGDLAAAVDASGLVEPLASRFEPDWIEACVGAGDLATARRALDRLTERHARLPRPWTSLGLARSRVLVAAAAGEDTAGPTADLLAARDAVAADVVPLDRARCLLVAGLAHRRARRRGAAAALLKQAATEFDALGARAFAARARAELDRIGATTAPDQLTASERRVAELAAAGATNREIADRLFIAPKTVEANLARVYRKLGIGRRAELAVALAAGGDPQVEGSA